MAGATGGGWAAFELVLDVPSADLSEHDVVVLSRQRGGRSGGGGGWRERLSELLPTVGIVTWREREGARRQLRLQVALPEKDFAHSGGERDGRDGGRRSVTPPADSSLPAHDTSTWPSLHVRKLGQLTTATREWLVLHKLVPADGAPDGALRPDLLADLLCARSSAVRRRAEREHRDEWERREKWQRLVGSVSSHQRMDEGQIHVLRETASMVYHDRTGFALVQGPPGTGKTTFLRALLNVLHNTATQEWFENVLRSLGRRAAGAAAAAGASTSAAHPGASTDAGLLGSITDGMTRQATSTPAQPGSGGSGPVRRGRILVCAQSNAALDELIARVLRLQFVDEFRNRYHADMVRLGSGPNESVRAVTLKARAADLASAALGTEQVTPLRPLESLPSPFKSLSSPVRLPSDCHW